MQDQDADEDESTSMVSEEVLLSQLMTALATGARAVQGLPLEDDFEYQSSFPEVQDLLEETHKGLLDLLLSVLGEYHSPEDFASVSAAAGSGATSSSMSLWDNLDDPLLWEACSDVCDALLEQAAADSTGNNNPQWRQELNTFKSNAQKSFGRLIQGIVEMEKPQLNIPGYNHLSQQQMDRRQPFVPSMVKKYHATVPLDLSLQPGHGLEDRFGGLRKVVIADNTIVAPDAHVEHPYQSEIQNLRFNMELYPIPETKPPSVQASKEPLTATWIDTPAALQEFAQKLQDKSVTMVAIDLEAHSYRSFRGLTCLIQMTFAQENYLIDPFPLWNQLPEALGPTLANPNVLKVLHGADSDIQWLQRDFGLYIVNLFDTGRAARALQLSSAGYAYLLTYYSNGAVTADKTHQLSDWRQRPLPLAMKEYAIMDTHYLIQMVPHLLYDLKNSKKKGNSDNVSLLEQVFEDSKKISLFRYCFEPFKPDGYKALTNRRGGNKTQLNPTQERVLKALWDWRDQTARQEDESHAYVCTNTQLLRLAMACPTNLGTLQNLLQPMPPLILRHSKSILGITMMQPITQRATPQHAPPSSAFFKPATSDRDSPRDNRLLSPVLGTEALYRQAGWISPHNHHNGVSDQEEEEEEAVVPATTTEDEDDDEIMEDGGSAIKPRRVLAVHETNKKYRANQFSAHSLQLSSTSNNSNSDIISDKNNAASSGVVVDGMGAARAAAHGTVDEDARVAQTNAQRIRAAQKEHGMIGFISPATDDDIMEGDDDDDDDDVDADDEAEDAGREKSQGDQEQDFAIPRSMREIYRISNRNRRNKKGGSISPPSAATSGELNEKENQELAKADEILKSRALRGEGGGGDGTNYLDEITGSPNRKRTKSTASMSSEEANGSVSREDDIALMQEIGWISGKEEVDAMMKQQQTIATDDPNTNTNANDDDSSDEEPTAPPPTKGKATTPAAPFDYSNIGAIGALSATPSSNPFFAGAATAGGYLNNQQVGKPQQQQQPSDKKKQNSNRGKQSRRQVERPERRGDGRSQVYKKR